MASTWWFDRNYSHRAIVCVPTASTTADHLTWAPAAQYDAFWGVVQSTGYDVRQYDCNGDNEAMERKTWDHTNRSASFAIGYADRFGATDYSEFRWVYWGYSAATDDSTNIAETVSVDDTGTQALTPPAGRTISCRPAEPGATAPQARIAKTSAESIQVWWNITPLLGASNEPINTRAAAALVLYGVDWDATAGTGVYLAGVRDGAMTTQSETTAYEDTNGDLWVGIRVLGGVADTDYTMSLRLQVAPVIVQGTGTAYLLETRALLQVRNPTE